ncbi:MAG: hypothetical protein JO104_03855 [Candidatus Eremiobacteraeota bacterium]|nr:hypothetical protein [Candidatus Eremiobacteraeota bacterium]
MTGRLSFGFVVVLVTAFIVAACGRQVTPNPPGLGPGGAPPGYMAVFFDTQAAFNFSSYQYYIVLNTTGSGVTPSTDTLQTNWAGYSFALVARGNGVSTYAQPAVFLRNGNPHIPPALVPLGTTPQNFSYNLNANGSGTEFSILAQRAIFKYNNSPSPSPSPSASPSNIWTFNAFTTQNNGQGQWYFLDSMGFGGPIDPQFVSPRLCMTQQFDNTYYARYQTSDPAAQIVSIEIANNPVTQAPCP